MNSHIKIVTVDATNVAQHGFFCYWVLLVWVALAFSGCTPPVGGEFTIYLLAEDLPPAEWSQADLNSLALQEQPVIATADIVAYARETHEIELTAAAYERVQGHYTLPVDTDGMAFVVRVGDDRIYAGAFWTPASSLSFEGITIMQPWEEDRRVIHIGLGYPTPEAFRGIDPRADPRIMQALEQAGRLK